MDKRQVFNKAYCHAAVRSRVKFGQKGSIPMDQSYSKVFNVDPNTGRPMSDVQRLVKEQNDLAMQAAFAQLQEFKSDFLSPDTKDSDALRFMCPRLSQLPSELLKYKDGLTSYQLQKQEEAAKLQAAKEKEQADAEYLEQFRQDLLNSNKD